MKKIAIANIKGGCGKTTIATNFSCLTAGENKKTILIDADTQGSSMKFRAERPEIAPQFQAVSILQNTIHKDINDFSSEFVFIDAGGRDNEIFRSALMAVDSIIIPITPSQYDIWSSENTFKMVKEIKYMYEEIKEIKVAIVLNMVIAGTSLSKEAEEVMDEYIKTYDLHLFNNVLYSRVAYKESVSEGLGVTEMKGEKYKKASDEMMSLYKEVMEWV